MTSPFSRPGLKGEREGKTEGDTMGDRSHVGERAIMVERPASNERTVTALLGASAAAPREARRVLSCVEGWIERKAYGDVTLLVSEIVTNSVLHAGLPPAARLELTVRASPGVVRVMVCDRGQGFLDALRGERRSAPGTGWGLRMLDTIASRWGIERSDTTCVWFEVRQDRGLRRVDG